MTSESGIKIYDGITPNLLNDELIKIIKDKAHIFKTKIKNIDCSIDDFVGYLTDLNVLEIDEMLGGYYSFRDKIIAVNPECYSNETIFHEVSHHIQNEAGLFENRKHYDLSDFIREEQQCETIAYCLHSLIDPKTASLAEYESTYFNSDGYEFLQKYYGFDENLT